MHKLKKDPARFLRDRIFFYCGDRGNNTATREKIQIKQDVSLSLLVGPIINLCVKSADAKTVVEIKKAGRKIIVLGLCINAEIAFFGGKFFCFFYQHGSSALSAVILLYF